MLLSILIFASAPLAAQKTPPAADDAGGDVILGASLSPATCNAGNAKRISFDTVTRSNAFVADECVAVSGFWAGRALFRTAAAANSDHSNLSKRFGAHRIGIYGTERLFLSAPKQAKRFMIVGQLRRCETAWPNALMVLGYCHYTDGPFLIASQAIAQRK